MSRYWIWSYRYNDNDELAILVAKNAYKQKLPDILNSDITRLIKIDKLIGVDVDRGFRPVGNFESTEWDTWLAFELCPAIEIYNIEVYNVDAKYNPRCNLGWKTLKA